MLHAQTDVLLELGTNPALASESAQISKTRSFNNKSLDSLTVLDLPFLDDFSQNWIYPNHEIWEDNYTYINSNFPDNPLSYGVATFDGLDETGYPYNFLNPTAYGLADELTSKRIDLSNISDSVYFSFYYQPQGLGNAPEEKDSLALEFYRVADSSWIHIWSTPGTTSHPFKQVILPVDVTYHNDQFRFRFKNYATLSGNVDHWHLDYVYLNDNRSASDTLLNDVAFITNFHNMLSDYTAMPWEHYLTDSSSYMAETMSVTYKNNHTSNYEVAYKYEIVSDNGNGSSIELYPSTNSSKNVDAFSSLVEPQAVFQTGINDFYFPVDHSTRTKVFEIKNYFDLRSEVDSLQQNDTVRSYQVFGNYYAYDDGSAEKGYGVEGVGSKLAHEFNIQKSDTLTAFSIYFNPIQDNLSTKSFRIMVWSSLNPETIVHQQTSVYNPEYSETNAFLTYELETPLYLNEGTYYIGWEKISSEFLTVGWDENTNNRDRIFINTTGNWSNSSFSGSLMLRPVFGTYENPIVNVAENAIEIDKADILLYPNPTSDELYIRSMNKFPLSEFSVQMMDLNGKRVYLPSTFTSEKHCSVKHLKNGIYFMIFTHAKNSDYRFTKKVIINH